MNSDSTKNYLDSSTGAGLWAYDDFNNEDDEVDQLWFDPWEGQIELSTDLSPKKQGESINDLLLEAEDGFDEFSILSPRSLEQRRGSSTTTSLLRQTSLPAAIFNSKFDNNFHSAHTLFWNHHHDSSSEDVSFVHK